MSRRMERNNWFVDNNELNISLMDYYIKISITLDFKFELTIYDSEMKTYNFLFNKLEDAVFFVEEILAKEKDKKLDVEKYKIICKEKNGILLEDNNFKEKSNQKILKFKNKSK